MLWSSVWTLAIMKLHTVDIIKDNLGSFCAGTHNPKMLRTTGRANFARVRHINTFPLLSDWLPPVSTPLMLGWRYYRLVCRKQIPGQGKGLSEGVSSVCLIERCVVNCLCVGGEKSICFLTAVTSRPWGERLELADTDAHTHTHTHSSAKRTPNHALQAQTCTCRPIPFLYWHTHSNAHMHTPSSEEEDVHEGLLSQGKVRSIYRSAACWERSQERETCTGQRAKRQRMRDSECEGGREEKREKPTELYS